MSVVVGLGTMQRIQWRTRRRSVLVWVLVLVGSLAGTALSIAALYDTPEKVLSYADAVAGDALVAINGRVEGIDSLGGVIQDEFGFMASFLMPLFGIALVTGLTRREEESGRLEALLGGRISRTTPVVSALLVTLAAALAVGVGCVVALVASGVPSGAAVLYSLALSGLTLVFAALAALLAQVVRHARGVYAVGLAMVGLAYVLRGVGDVTHTGVTWLSPLGWVEKAAPFGAQRWWVLAVPLGVTLALAAAAVRLAERRDLGSALWSAGPGSGRAPARLLRPVGLATSVHRASFLGWLAGSVVLAAVMGLLAQPVIEAILGNPSISAIMVGVGSDPAVAFLAMTQVYLAVLACGYVVQALGGLHREEAAGRLEPLLAGVVPRRRWLGAHLLVVLTGLVVIVLTSAVVFGLTTAWSTGETGYLRTLLGAGLAYLPAELVLAGLALLLFGAQPRAHVVAWAAFGLVTFIAFLGPGLQLPGWVLDLSPTTHVGNPPQGHVLVMPLVVLSLVAAVLVAAGFAAFGRRTVPQG